jgi:alkanesulfonate monooxygenase SsuD/methylene tetrahydromethanopterin reductase-like flavin-dependent oxidoreductase (luciferase family)
MQRAFILPGGTASEQLELAILAEESGWDGVFVWEAVRTSRIKLGTLLTPLPWRRPWKVASQVVTLDQLSHGRAILTVGLGALSPDLPMTGEATDLRERADRLDEGIDLIRVLWDGGSSYHGRFYDYASEQDDLTQVGRPVQDRIPIWVVGAWPRPKSMRRVLRCNGIVPQYDLDGREGTPDDLRELRAWLTEHGARPDIDVIAEGETPADSAGASAVVTPWVDAGCTWWLETR